MKRLATRLFALVVLVVAGPVFADCAADATVRDVRDAFARGQQKEKEGDARAALAAYVAAQEYTCDPDPVAGQAAARAAALAKPLGDAARAKGDHAAAFDYYERGGHFAAADRELIARIEASPDDVQLYSEALSHSQYRSSPAFQANEKVRLGVTGAYTPDPALARTVAAMPGKAVERTLAAEAAAFDEKWYREYLALTANRPEDPTDMVAVQQYSSRLQALHTGRAKDPLQEPLELLSKVRSWESAVRDNDLAASISKQRTERAESRAALLTQKYADAPRLLELAIDYLAYSAGDSAVREPRVHKVRRQAEGLGDQALSARRYQLAIEYFDVAGADAKRSQAQAAAQADVMRQMQPSISAMQRDAEALKAQFGDPRKIAEMQRQAQELQRQMQANKEQRGGKASRDADDLAAELGL